MGHYCWYQDISILRSMQMKTSHLVKDERGDGIFAVSCLLIDYLIVSTCVYIKQLYLKINQKKAV